MLDGLGAPRLRSRRGWEETNTIAAQIYTGGFVLQLDMPNSSQKSQFHQNEMVYQSYWGLDMSCVFEPVFRLQTLPHVGLIEHVGETSQIPSFIMFLKATLGV